MRYRSKKDTWILVALYASPLIPFILGILYLILPGIPGPIGWLLLLIGIVMEAFFQWLIATTYYEITPSSLLVHSGWLHRDIALNSISQVFPTHNALSSPALSLDRLQVDYTKDDHPHFIIISPEDKLRFMYDLAGTSSDLEVRDDRVVHRS